MPLPVPPSLGAFSLSRCFKRLAAAWFAVNAAALTAGGPFNTTEYAAALPSWLWVAGTAGVFLLLSLPALRSRHPLDDYYLLGGSLLYGVGLVGSYTGAASYGFVGVVLLALAFLLVALEDAAEGVVPFSGLLAVLGTGLGLRRWRRPAAERLTAKFGKLWVAAEVMLFVLVGAEVDIGYAAAAGLAAVATVLGVLCFRAVGVLLCVAGSRLSGRERLFAVLAYLPKATVQAAIGGVPLAMGLACGQVVLTVAVVAILVTAPLGALAIDLSFRRLLRRDRG